MGGVGEGWQRYCAAIPPISPQRGDTQVKEKKSKNYTLIPKNWIDLFLNKIIYLLILDELLDLPMDGDGIFMFPLQAFFFLAFINFFINYLFFPARGDRFVPSPLGEGIGRGRGGMAALLFYALPYPYIPPEGGYSGGFIKIFNFIICSILSG